MLSNREIEAKSEVKPKIDSHKYPIKCILTYASEKEGKVTEVIDILSEEAYKRVINRTEELKPSGGKLYKLVDANTVNDPTFGAGNPFFIKRRLEEGEYKTYGVEMRNIFNIRQTLSGLESCGGELYQKIYPNKIMERCYSARDLAKQLRENSERARKDPRLVGPCPPRF